MWTLPPCQIWLPKVEWFRKYLVDKAPKHGNDKRENRTDEHSDSSMPPPYPTLCYWGYNNIRHRPFSKGIAVRIFFGWKTCDTWTPCWVEVGRVPCIPINIHILSRGQTDKKINNALPHSMVLSYGAKPKAAYKSGPASWPILIACIISSTLSCGIVGKKESWIETVEHKSL